MITKTEFQNLTYDLCFKNLFINKRILEDFVNSLFHYLALDTKLLFLDIKSQKYMIPKNKNFIGYLGDIVATLDNDTIISLEMYRNTFAKKHYNKSYAYMCRLFDQNINNSYEYKNHKIISINFMNGNYKRNNNDFINRHEFRNIKTNKASDNGNMVMYLIRIDKLENIPYTKSNERLIQWLKLMTAKSIQEMESIGKEDEIMNEAIEFVKRWNNKSPQENFDNYVRTQQRYAYEDGEDAGMKKGKIEGKIEGKLETAKNLLALNFKIDDIVKATGLSLKEIEKIKHELE